MAIIDHNTGRITSFRPLPQGEPGWHEVLVPRQQVSTVVLSRPTEKPEPCIYSKPITSPANTAAAAKPGATGELSPTTEHPKALSASRVFLEIAHFDSGEPLVDVYA